MSRPAGSAPTTDDDVQPSDFDDLRAALDGTAAEPTDDEVAAATTAEDEAVTDLEAELGRGLDDEEDEGGDEVITDEELAAELEATDDDADDDAAADETDEGAAPSGADEVAGAGEGAAPSPASPGDQPAAAEPAEAPAGAPVSSAGESAWEPFAVTADKEAVAIEEAVVSKVNGHFMIAVREQDMPRFRARIQRAIIGEKTWRAMEAEKAETAQMRAQLEQEASRKTAAEIEAEETLKLLTREQLEAILDARDLDLLDERIARRKAEEGVRTVKPTAATAPTETPAAPASAADPADAPAEPTIDFAQAQKEGIAVEMLAIIDHFPELQAIPEAERVAAYRELYAERDQVFWRGGDGYYSNRDRIYEKLKARVPAKDPAPAPAPKDAAAAPAAAATPATEPPAPAPAAAPRQSAATANRAETYNRGVNSAARPTTTSVKARREANAARPAAAGATRNADRPRARTQAEEQAELDAEWERTKRGVLRSDGLDIDDEE